MSSSGFVEEVSMAIAELVVFITTGEVVELWDCVAPRRAKIEIIAVISDKGKAIFTGSKSLSFKILVLLICRKAAAV